MTLQGSTHISRSDPIVPAFDGVRYCASPSYVYKLAATDNFSGTDHIEYSLDTSAFTVYSAPFNIPSAGTHVINCKAVDRAGNWETQKSFAIFVDNVAPPAPTGLTGTQNNMQLQLSWNASPAADLAGYNIYRDGLKKNSSLLGAVNFSDSVSGSTSYSYNVTAVDKVGNESPFSAAFSITTAATAPMIKSPYPGQKFIVSPISVSGISDPGAEIEVFVNGVSSAKKAALTSGDFSVSGVVLSEGDNLLTAKATNSRGITGPVSNAVLVRLDPKPLPVAGLKAAAGDTVIDLSWDTSSETDIAGYKVYRDNAGTSLNYGLLTVTQFKDEALTNKRAYTYQVTAIDKNGSESDKNLGITASGQPGTGW